MTASTSPGVTPANSARSDASCAIFVPDGVTRWSKSRAAIVPLRGVERLDRALEVVGHDLPGAAERLEGRRTQRGRPGGALDVPQPLHHELQVRRLDPARGAVALGDAETARAELDPSRADAVEDTLDEHVLGDDLLAFELAPALQGPDDRRPPGNPVEPVETQDVGEQARDVAFEPVEPRERVLAQRQEHVDAQRAVDDSLRAPSRSRARSRGR